MHFKRALKTNINAYLQAKLPRDFAGAEFPRVRADEGDKGVPLWKNLVALLCHAIRLPCRRFS